MKTERNWPAPARAKGWKPPSRIRYEKTHPVVSARIGLGYHKRLKKILKTECKSFAQFSAARAKASSTFFT